MADETPKRRRGFGAMSPERQREIAALGGKAAHAKGTAHEFSTEKAREAGKLGGQAAQRARSRIRSLRAGITCKDTASSRDVNLQDSTGEPEPVG